MEGMRDRGSTEGDGRGCVHTPHTCQWLVVCGLRWLEGGKEGGGVMKGGSGSNSDRNCVKDRCDRLKICEKFQLSK